MKRYGIWKFTLLTDSGEIKRCEITARSGKDAKRRVESAYEGCEVLKMARVMWLDGFVYDELYEALRDCVPGYAGALLKILADNGVFSAGENKSETVD